MLRYVCVEIQVPVEIRKLVKKKKWGLKGKGQEQSCTPISTTMLYLLYTYLLSTIPTVYQSPLNNYTILAVNLCPHNNYGIPAVYLSPLNNYWETPRNKGPCLIS